jgi:hypothetical protein
MFYNMVLKLGLWTMTKMMKWNNAPAWWPFRWPWWLCTGAMRHILPNGRFLGLHELLLDIAIGCLLTLYCPGGRQGCMQNTMMKYTRSFVAILMATLLYGHSDGHRNVPVRYNIMGIAQWRRSRTLLELTGRHQQGSICSKSIRYGASQCGPLNNALNPT